MPNFQFPASPTEGQIYAPAGGPQYVYRAPYWRASGRVDTIVAETPPAGPKPGQLWFDSSSGNTYIWYEDPNSAQWVQINVGPGGGAGRTLFSIDYAGSTLADRANAAISDAVTGDTVNIDEGGSHTITTPISIVDKGIMLDIGATEIIVGADVNAIKAYCTPLGWWALTADYVAGALTFPVAAMDRAPRKGEWFMIFSEAIDPANRDRGTDPNQYRVGERFQAEGGTATSITLKRPLRFTRGVETTGSVKIDSYTLAKNARVLRYQDMPLEIRGGTISHMPGASGWIEAPVWVRGWVRPRIYRTRIGFSCTTGFSPYGNIEGDFRDMEARNMSPDGYGISLAGDTRSRVKGMAGYDCRHTITENTLTRAVGTTTKELIIATGRSVGTLVEGCASYGSSSAGFDTHHGATDWTFRDNYVGSSNHWALSLRGLNNHVDGLVARNCTNGLQVFTEYHATGEAGDEFYVSGKPEGITSAAIGNLDIQCEASALALTNAKVKIFGYNRLVTNTIQTITCNGALAELFGTIDHVVAASTADNIGLSMFYSDPAAPAVGADFDSTINFMHNSVVKVDASAATATGACSIFDTRPGAFLRMHGAMQLVVPTAITQKYGSGITGSGSLLTVVHGEDQHMEITGAGAAALDTTRRGFTQTHYALNDKTKIYEFRSLAEGLADDVMVSIPAVLSGGVIEVFLVDWRATASPANVPTACTFAILDPTISSAENIAIISNDPSGLFMAFNVALTTANVTDGKVGIAYFDNTIQIMVRLGQAAPMIAAFRGWGTRL